MEPAAGVDVAIEAALAAGAMAGYAPARAEVLQQTNNVVVWLAPHPIVAKVGRWPHSRRLLQLETEVCDQLVGIGSPVVVPVRDSGLHSGHGMRPGAGRFGSADLPVSLWRQLDHRGPEPTPADVAALLRRVHEDLLRVDAARLQEPLPAWHEDAHPSPSDVVLHGDPHAGNVVSTSHGPVMIDFETVCVGPLEWDLAALPSEVVEEYARRVPVDHARLAELRALRGP